MRTKKRTYRLSGGRRNLTQKAGGRKHRKKNPKGKKKNQRIREDHSNAEGGNK